MSDIIYPKVLQLIGTNISSNTSSKTYKITSYINKGQFACTFRCQDQTNNEYAIKVLPLLLSKKQKDQLSKGGAVEVRPNTDLHIFLREAKIGLEANNFNCIKYYDIWRDDEYFYVTMDYCEGGTFEDYLKLVGALTEEDSLEYLKQIVNAMKYFHTNKRVHRDLKPDNMLIKDGELKIADFGFAKDLGNDLVVSSFKGTAIYAPTWSWKGFGPNDCAQDIYSVGIIFYRMVFGVHPFYEEGFSKADVESKVEEFISNNKDSNMGDLVSKYKELTDKEMPEDLKSLFKVLLLNSIMQQDSTWENVINHPLIKENESYDLKL